MDRWHRTVADLPAVAKVVRLDERGSERIAAAVAFAPLPVDADPHGGDVIDPLVLVTLRGPIGPVNVTRMKERRMFPA